MPKFLPPDIKQHLLDYVCEQSIASSFEAWLYNESSLEAVLTREEFIDVLSGNYATDEGKEKTRELIAKILTSREPQSIERYRAEIIINEVLKGAMPLLIGLRKLTTMLRQGRCDFIPEVLSGYESETDTVPDEQHYHQWKPKALAKQLERLEWYKTDILKELEQLLNNLQQERQAT